MSDTATPTSTREPAAPAVMYAAVLAAPRRIELRETPVPRPGPGQVRVRVEGCGVCASSVPAWEGREWFNYPLPPGRPGHEGWGVVESVGDGVTDVARGQRVAVLADETFAPYVVADASKVVALPDRVGAEPFPAEPLGCVMNIFRRSDIRAGQTVAILGSGFLGALLIQLCAAAGARVIAVSPRPFSLEVARRQGAHERVRWHDNPTAIEQVAHLTGGVGGYGEVTGWCDRVIECTGRQEALDVGGEIIAVRGKLVLAGFHQDGRRSVDVQLWNWRGIDVINAHERDDEQDRIGIRDAMHRVADGTLRVEPLITHRLPLSELATALDLTAQRPDGFVKAVVMMDDEDNA